MSGWNNLIQFCFESIQLWSKKHAINMRKLILSVKGRVAKWLGFALENHKYEISLL